MNTAEIDIDELEARLAQGAVLIDVRRVEEHDEANIPQATLIPLDQIPDRVDEIPSDAEVLVICRSGGRSAAACEFLMDNGRNPINVVGGMVAWIESGRPVGGTMGTSLSE